MFSISYVIVPLRCPPLAANVGAAWRQVAGSLPFMRGAKLSNLHCRFCGLHRHLRQTARCVQFFCFLLCQSP